jgi:phosphate transport system permease protein
MDAAFKGGMLTCLGLALVTLAAVLVQVFTKGVGQLDLNFITDLGSSLPDQAGIGSALVGTLWVMAVCVAFIVPVGVASAVYLEEYADPSRWYNRFIEVNIQNLAAVPSIVYGILGLAFLVRGPLSLGHVVLAAGLTLGLLVLPVVVIAGREAIRAVPPSIREGSLALGATKWQTIWRQVLPASVPGFATGVILAVSRAIGEAAPLIVVGGAIYLSFYPSGLDSQFTVLPLQIFNWISQPQDEFKDLAAAGMIVLLAILLLLNGVAIWLRNKFEKNW